MSSSPGLDLSQKRRVFVEGIDPCVECGRWPVKRVVGDLVEVKADVFADGHDWVAAALLYRSPSVAQWVEVPMVFVDNDRWQAAFPVGELGLHRYAVEGWVDTFKTWRHDLEKRLNAGQDVKVDLKIGAELVDAARQRALGTSDAKLLAKSYAALATPLGAKTALGPELTALMERYPDRGLATRSQEFEVSVERLRARFSSWYEIFPRSTSPNVGAHGTFHTLLARLPEISAMGFDVVYLPPIHPIGKSFRKGPNNAPEAGAGDPGSPWGIGGEEGGHRAIHPDLGTLDDFREVIGRARELGMEIALDIALQCSPDHPYVRDHPDWFRRRPDGSIQYAENPPKRYQDIYPFDF
ncbi:MAG TPA: maltotransferase domain-containing protein, partial [Candidatus Dormibacteraeota bacterium]|nr:maltotransferase domain-containing protein [Candidatus Dormibacteraeota bacterium]